MFCFRFLKKMEFLSFYRICYDNGGFRSHNIWQNWKFKRSFNLLCFHFRFYFPTIIYIESLSQICFHVAFSSWFIFFSYMMDLTKPEHQQNTRISISGFGQYLISRDLTFFRVDNISFCVCTPNPQPITKIGFIPILKSIQKKWFFNTSWLYRLTQLSRSRHKRSETHSGIFILYNELQT